MKKLLALVVAMMMAFAFMACDATGSTEPKKAEEATAEKPAAAEELAPGEWPVEDKLVVYTACSEKLWDAYSTAFKEMYPDCEIEVVYGGQGEMVARLQGEAENPVADLVFAGFATSDGDKYFEYLDPYNSTYADELTIECPNEYYTPFCNSVICFCVNKDLEKELGLDIRSYQDLLNPALKGKIIMSDPNSSSAAWNNLMNMNCAFGVNSDALWEYVEKLMPNLVVSSSSSATYNSVADGEYVIGLSMESGTSNVIIDGADWCELRYPTEGASGIDGCACVVKNCKHPNAAKAFIDSVTSQAGTTRIYEVYPNGRLNNKYTQAPDVPEALLSNAEMNWLERPVLELTKLKGEILDKWNSIYAKVFG